MFTIINKQLIANNVKRMDLKAEAIAQKARPGQYVILMPDEKSARLSFPIIEADILKGSISICFKETSVSAKRLGALQIGAEVPIMVGPLGIPISFGDLRKGNFVVCVGYGLGIGHILPVARELKRLDCRVIGIIGVKNRRAMMLESQTRITSDQIMITTDDGSYERKGFVTGSLREMMAQHKIKLVIAAAPVPILQAVAETTKEAGIRTLVYFTPPIIDGLGLCGSCRVKVAGRNVLASVEGPVFDGHEIDFKDLIIRTKHDEIQETWPDQLSQPNPFSVESPVLTKWLKGLLKNKP